MKRRLPESDGKPTEKTNRRRLVACFLCGIAFRLCVACGVTMSDGDRERYAEVFAPRVVAELPCQEASYTMCMMPDGRIRFYGWQMDIWRTEKGVHRVTQPGSGLEA